MKLLKGLFILNFFGSLAWAMDMRLDQVKTKSFLGASAEFSQFNLEEGSISGSGVKVDFHHAFSEKTSMEVYLASAINTSGGASFTGLGGYIYYNLFGECCLATNTVFMDGKPLITERSVRRQNVLIGMGLDQFFLNGSKSVYSASGLGLAAIYQFVVFGYNFKAEVRHSQMSAGQNKIQGTFASLGMVFIL